MTSHAASPSVASTSIDDRTPTPGRADACTLVAASASLAVVIVGLTGLPAATLVLASLASSLGAAIAVRATGQAPRGLWPAVAVLAVASVMRAPIRSHDIWSYAFYGRMISRYGADPYTRPPSAFSHDPLYALVGWRQTRTAYGPLFTGLSALISRAAGDSVLMLRLAFQALAALAVSGCLVALHRARQHATLTLVALQPFIWITVVNGGHNDALLAALLLGVAICLRAEHPGRAAGLAALAIGVKLSAVFFIGPAAILLLVRRRTRAGGALLGTTAVALAASLVIAPRSLGNASRASWAKMSLASIWRAPASVLHLDPTTTTTAATFLALVAIAWVTFCRRADDDPSTAAGSAVAVYPMFSAYVLPWYFIWGLPTIALGGDLALAGVVAARGSMMLASYELGASTVSRIIGVVLTDLIPLALCALFLRSVSLHRAERAAATERR